MTKLIIDLSDVAGGTHPEDTVVVWSPVHREGSAGRTVSPTQHTIRLTEGVGELEVEPGPLMVQTKVRAIADTRPKEVVVPDQATVTLWDLLEQVFQWTPPLVNRALQAIIDALEDALTQVSEAVDAEVDAIKWPKGSLGTASLDTITNTGLYWQESTSQATAGRKYPVGAIGYLNVITWSGRTVQTYYPHEGGVWTRRLVSGQWSPWWASHDNRGALPAGTDMDQIRGLTMHGTWTIMNDVAPTIVNGPPNVVRGTLELLTTHSWTIVQRFSFYTGEVWERISAGGSTWNPWKRVAFHDDVEDIVEGMDLAELIPSSPVAPVSQDWVHWGDSLTDDLVTGVDAWVTQLAAKTGREHSNQGWYNQGVRNIAARAGALQPIVTVEGGSIPAAGGTVGLSSVANMPTISNKRTQVQGLLAGREGYLSTTSDGVDQFTATSGTTSTTCPPKSVFTITEQEATSPNRHATIWAGFNDRFDMEPWEIVSIIGEMVERHTVEGARRVMVLQLPQSGSSTPDTGTHQKVVEINRLLAQEFPTLYLPICDWLRTEEAATVAGITFTSQDRADIANGVVPTSFRSDWVHFNAAGCTAIAAYVYDQAAARGWMDAESVYSSMRKTEEPALVPRVDTSAGTRIYLGDHLVFGDTGWRDITSMYAGPSPLDMGDGAKIMIRRRDDDVILRLTGPITANSSWGNLVQLVTGWNPYEDTAVPLAGTDASARHSRYWVVLEGLTSGDQVVASGRSVETRWTARDEWPNSQPGTPA